MAEFLATTDRAAIGLRARWRGSLRTALLGGLVAAATLLFTANALAASGKPINVGTPFDVGELATAVDGSGNGYIVWSNTKDLAPETVNVVQYCVVAPGGTGCSHSGTLTPADGAAYIDNVQVLVDGTTVVILADVYGAQGSAAEDYQPEQEWQSTDGGAIFSIVDGGKSVANGTLSADTGPLSALIVPGTGELGYGWDSAASLVMNVGAAPTFDAFPLTSPPECSERKCPTGEHYAVLEPDTNPDQIGNPFGQFASELSPTPGVLAVFETDFTNGPLGCPSSSPFGTAFAYGSGTQSSTNSYDISPGSPNSAWKIPIAQADCNVDNPAVGGGPSGLGILEDNGATNTTIYHKFDQLTDSFDTSEVQIAGEPESDPSLSQDGTGGIYATYLGGGGGGPVTLSYSNDGGAAWSTGVINPDSDSGAGDLTSSVGPSDQGWAAWVDNGSVFAQQFDAADAVAAAIGGTASSTGTTVTVPLTCTSVPCTLTVTITGTKVIVTKASIARRRHHRETFTIARRRVTLTKSGVNKVKIRLRGAGKRFLASHRHYKAKIVVINHSLFNEKLTGTLKINTHLRHRR